MCVGQGFTSPKFDRFKTSLSLLRLMGTSATFPMGAPRMGLIRSSRSCSFLPLHEVTQQSHQDPATDYEVEQSSNVSGNP